MNIVKKYTPFRVTRRRDTLPWLRCGTWLTSFRLSLTHCHLKMSRYLRNSCSLIMSKLIKELLTHRAYNLRSNIYRNSVWQIAKFNTIALSLRRKLPEWLNRRLLKVNKSKENFKVLFTRISSDKLIPMQLCFSCLEQDSTNLQSTIVNNMMMISLYMNLESCTNSIMKLTRRAWLRLKSQISSKKPQQMARV